MCRCRPATPSPHRCNGCSTAEPLHRGRRNMPTSMPTAAPTSSCKACDNRFYVSLSTGVSFTAPVQWMQHGGTFTAGQPQYADVNGDGLADLILQSNDNRFFVSPSTGDGFSAPMQWMQHGGTFTPGQAQYADVNGDSKYDLL